VGDGASRGQIGTKARLRIADGRQGLAERVTKGLLLDRIGERRRDVAPPTRGHQDLDRPELSVDAQPIAHVGEHCSQRVTGLHVIERSIDDLLQPATVDRELFEHL
jgi:hypothetical protein